MLELIRYGCGGEQAGEDEPHDWSKYTMSEAKIDKLLQVSPRVRSIKVGRHISRTINDGMGMRSAAASEAGISSGQGPIGVGAENSRQPEGDDRSRPPKQTKKTTKRPSKKRITKKTSTKKAPTKGPPRKAKVKKAKKKKR